MSQMISVWSSTKKTGKSVLTYLIANHIQRLVDEKVKIFIGCFNLNYGNLMDMFDVHEKELNFEDIVNYNIKPDKPLNLINSVASKGNLFFMGSRRTRADFADRNMKLYENILVELKANFDLIILDTISGHDNTLTNMLLKKSDHILNVITQDKEILNRNNFTNEKDMAYIINKYHDIYPRVKDLEGEYKLNNIFTLPKCLTLLEMKNRDKLKYYTQHETEYNTSLQEIAIYVAEKTNLSVLKADTEKKKSFFDKFLNNFSTTEVKAR